MLDSDLCVVYANVAAQDLLAVSVNQARGKPFLSLVLEADSRVGGRILTEVVDGVPLELGAQWIGDTHERMFALAAELGVETFPQYDEGETSYELMAPA
jgi:monoamine oxidase